MTVIPEILLVPSAVPSALAVQTCSSRKPLPTPPPFEYPIENGPVVFGAVVAPELEQAVATSAIVARPTSSLAVTGTLDHSFSSSCQQRADVVASTSLDVVPSGERIDAIDW